MKNKHIKIVMWDYGGVLTNSPIRKFHQFEVKFGLPANTIININTFNKYNNAWAKLEKNLISLEEFSDLFNMEAKLLGIENINTNELLDCLHLELKKDMVELLKLIAKNYICVCLTNNFSNSDNKNFGKVKSYFKHIFESSKLAMRKPEKQIYQHVLKVMKVQAKEILFIDDLGINLKPAREIGFHTYKFIDSKRTIDYLYKNFI